MCSNVEETSEWGTIKTSNYPEKLSSNENCWCKLSTSNNQRIVLSVISFQLETNNNECLQAGLYLQSETNLKPSNNCTHLVKDHYYISSSQILYLNFLSKYSNANGFWIIYEATDSDSKINLKCGSINEINELRTKEFTIDQANTSTITTTLFQPTTSTTSSSTKLVLKKNSTRKQQVLMKQFISSIKPDLTDRKKVLKLMTLKTKKKSTTLSITLSSTTTMTSVTNTSLRYLFNQSITNETTTTTTTSKLILYFISIIHGVI